MIQGTAERQNERIADCQGLESPEGKVRWQFPSTWREGGNGARAIVEKVMA